MNEPLRWVEGVNVPPNLTKLILVVAPAGEDAAVGAMREHARQFAFDNPGMNLKSYLRGEYGNDFNPRTNDPKHRAWLDEVLPDPIPEDVKG